MKKLLYLLLIVISSCSLFSSKSKVGPYDLGDYSLHMDDDYKEQLASQKKAFLGNGVVKKINLSKKSHKYLSSIYYKIVQNNELLLVEKHIPKFYVVKNKTPFYFSLPRAQFFLSSGLITKYLRNENLLISVLAYETIKSLKGIYKKKIITPVGYIYTEKLLSLVRLPIEQRIELKKWTYYAVSRAGFDVDAILNWIQVQNKSILDFSLQYGNTQKLIREEFLFKNFIVNSDIAKGKSERVITNSSSLFYKFIYEVKRKGL